MGASTPQVSRRVHWRACQFGILGALRDTRRWKTAAEPATRAQPPFDFAKRRATCPSARCHMWWKTLGGPSRAISLLVYQIGARFLGHRRMAAIVAVMLQSAGDNLLSSHNGPSIPT